LSGEGAGRGFARGQKEAACDNKIDLEYNFFRFRVVKGLGEALHEAEKRLPEIISLSVKIDLDHNFLGFEW
jgi:hypothetical protein